jgi:hypothetical protein
LLGRGRPSSGRATSSSRLSSSISWGCLAVTSTESATSRLPSSASCPSSSWSWARASRSSPVARQKRISFDDDYLFIDLVFYNILLKCYLLIDLELGRLTHQDVGQMDSYVRIFDAHERAPGDGPTIGLILCAEENHTIARYSVLNEYKQLFAAKYLTYLPTEEELRRELERDRRLAEASVETPREEKPTKPKRATRAKGRRK